VINAIVLAAGESSRMGRPKPLLRFGDATFLEHILCVLRSSVIERITVVLGAGAEAVRRSTDLSGVHAVVNGDYARGQLSSLIAGIETVPPETEGVLVCLVDHPFITVAIVNQVVARFRERSSPIVIPVFHGKRGHPALFSRSMFGAIADAPADQGARYVIHANEDRLTQIETDDEGVVISIDTPADYRSYLGAEP